MSLILSIETASHSAGCAIGSGSDIKCFLEVSEPQKHYENLIPLIQQALKKSDATISDLDLIAVDIGPGLYTGLRVGIATAQFLAYGLKQKGVDIKCLGISSLDLQAFQSLSSEMPVISVLDAKRGEVFYGIYESGFWDSKLKGVCSPKELATQIQNFPDSKICVGDGVALYQDIFEAAGCQTKDDSLSAKALVQLAAKANPSDYISPDQLQPLYLRKPDANV